MISDNIGSYPLADDRIPVLPATWTVLHPVTAARRDGPTSFVPGGVISKTSVVSVGLLGRRPEKEGAPTSTQRSAVFGFRFHICQFRFLVHFGKQADIRTLRLSLDCPQFGGRHGSDSRASR